MDLRIKTQEFLTGLDRGAWLRFLVAVGGLGLAFGAALFSSIFREQGNILATALAASVALLIAGAVAFTTVPYLAKRVALEGIRESFDYDVTREGVVYLISALVIGIAALNTGNNLLFIVLAAMLGAIVVSGLASAAVLRGLGLEVSLPPHAFAGREMMGRVTLHNRKRLLPSFSIGVVPPVRHEGRKSMRWERCEFAFPPGRERGKEWMVLPDRKLRVRSTPAPRGEAIIGQQVYFPYVPRGESCGADVELNFPRRGRYVQDALGVSTRFPFSFLRKTRRVALGREVIVYPTVDETDELLEVLPMITGECESFIRGRGYDLYRIREHMPEDSARHVDWKATAKSGSLKVREFTREDERKLRIVFDNPAGGEVKEAAYERGVALAASLAWHFAAENTELSYAAPGFAGNGADLYEFLRYLALVGPGEPGGNAEFLEKLELTDDYNIVLTSRERGSIRTELWAGSYLLFFDAQ